MNIHEIRRENLRTEAARVGGAARLSEKLDKSESEISQLIGKTPTSNLGSRRARSFEEILGLPNGTLDQPPDTGQFRQSAIMQEIGKHLSNKGIQTQEWVLDLLRKLK